MHDVTALRQLSTDPHRRCRWNCCAAVASDVCDDAARRQLRMSTRLRKLTAYNWLQSPCIFIQFDVVYTMPRVLSVS